MAHTLGRIGLNGRIISDRGRREQRIRRGNNKMAKLSWVDFLRFTPFAGVDW